MKLINGNNPLLYRLFFFKVLDLIKSLVADERVKLELVKGFDPLPISSYDEQSFGYQIIKKTVQGIFPQVNVAPGKSVGYCVSKCL